MVAQHPVIAVSYIKKNEPKPVSTEKDVLKTKNNKKKSDPKFLNTNLVAVMKVQTEKYLPITVSQEDL